MEETKFIILHYHIFKNAGSTIESILKNNFGSEHYDLHGPNPNSSITMHDVKSFVSNRPNIKSISSHHLRYPVLDFGFYKIVDIVYIRHPVDRLYSMFNYYRSIDWVTALPELISENFAEFLKKIFVVQPYNSINAQTNFYVNPGDYYFPPNENDLEIAIYNARKTRWLGTVDNLDKSLYVVKHFLSPIFNDLDISYSPKNISTSLESNVNVKLKIEMLREEFGEIIGRAEKFNQLDMMLWTACNDEIERRYSFCKV